MLWLYITIVAYLLFAVANLGDKLVVSKFKTPSAVYAFYVGIMGSLAIILVPFGVVWPNLATIFWSIVGGAAFILAAFSMYQALSLGETSKSITIMGATAPIFTLVLSYFFLGERLAWAQVGAFALLVVAIIFIARPQGQQKVLSKQIKWAIVAGVIFAISYVTAKYVYATQPFLSGFVWIRLGGVLTALVFLLSIKNRQAIKKDWRRPKKEEGVLILLIQIFGGLGVVGQNYAFALASATLVNALQAIQYAAIFILARLLSKRIPTFKEPLSKKQLIQKVIALILIAFGLYILAIN